MSKAVKVVAGAALMYFSAGTASVLMGGGFSGATMITAGWGVQALAGAITLVGASLMGSALAPEMPDMGGADAYAGQKLQTRKDNVSAVPQVFGENRVGGNIIWQSSGEQISGADNKDYWAIIAVAEGEIDSFVEMYANEDTMVDKGSNKFTTTYAHIKGYENSGTGMVLADVEFVTDNAGATSTWGSLGETFGASHLTPINTCSTSMAGPCGVEYLIDGNIDSGYWASCQEENIWIEIDINTPMLINSINVRSFSLYSFYKFRLEYWDGSVWQSAGEWNQGQGGYYASWKSCTNTLQTAKQAKWRLFFEYLYGEDGDGNTNTVELTGLDISADIASSVTIPSNLAFLAVHQKFDATDNKHSQLDNITALIKGKKIDGVYSNNPAVIIEHLLKDSLNIDSSDIDSASFANVEAKCNEYGYTANISFYQQVNIQSAIRDVLATCRGQIVFSQGKWKLKMDEKNATVVKALTSDDILNSSLSISMKGFQEIANKIDLKYINPLDNWLSAKVEKNDTALISMDGQEIVKTLDVKGITNTAQANKLAEITLNSMRYTEDEAGNRIKQTPLAISFATTIKNAELEVGDVISLDHELLGARVRKFVILSVDTDQSGAIQISAREYCNQHYKNSSGVYLI